jgi:hypothetical protein
VVGFVAVAEIVLVSTSLSLYNNKLGGGSCSYCCRCILLQYCINFSTCAINVIGDLFQLAML